MENYKTKILLFGRTGSGKSTIANMMIKGNLNSPLLFETSSGIRGKTIFFQKEENEKYMVVDTVGFGEAEQGTVSDVEARNRLYDFFTKINETGYNYFAYVHKWGKIDELDTHLWSFFKKAFEGVEQNFVILFTHCKHSTLEENLEDVKASFEGCNKYIAIDFPPCSSKHEGSNPARSRRDEMMRARSLKCLQDALDNYKCPLAMPSLRSTMRKGRVLLLGTCASVRNMIAKLLVNGTLDPNLIIGKKGGQQDEASCSSSISGSTRDITPSLNVPTIEATMYEELEGRGWQVVNVTLNFHPFLVESKDVFCSPFFLEIEDPMTHGSYSHIIYIEQCGNTSTEVKIMQERITQMLMVVEDHLVAIIVETKGGDHNTKWNNTRSQREKYVTERFKRWKTLLYLQFPSVSNNPNVEVENIVVRNKSLHMLEEALSDMMLPYFLFKYPTQYDLLPRTYYVTKAFGPLDALSRFYRRKFSKYDFRSFIDKAMQPLHLALDYPTSYEVFRITPPPLRYGEKMILLELKSEISSPQKISLVMEYAITCNSIDQNWTWGELQVVDMHHVDKNIPRLALTFNQWKEESKYTNVFNKVPRMKFSIDVSRYNEDIRNQTFLDNIEKGDTIIFWHCYYPLKDKFHLMSVRMQIEPSQATFSTSS